MVLWRLQSSGESRWKHENMDRLRRRAYAYRENGPEVEQWAILLDMVLVRGKILAHASKFGVNPGVIDVMVENDVLTTKATSPMELEHKEGNCVMKEPRAGAFYR